MSGRLTALFRAPAHAGAPAATVGSPPAAARAGEPGGLRWVHGEAGRRRDGALLRFHLQLDPAGRVAAARFQAYGCPWTLAAAEWVAGLLAGRELANLVPGTPRQWAAELGVPVERLGRLLVIEDALRAAGRAASAAEASASGESAGVATDFGLQR